MEAWRNSDSLSMIKRSCSAVSACVVVGFALIETVSGAPICLCLRRAIILRCRYIGGVSIRVTPVTAFMLNVSFDACERGDPRRGTRAIPLVGATGGFFMRCLDARAGRLLTGRMMGHVHSPPENHPYKLLNSRKVPLRAARASLRPASAWRWAIFAEIRAAYRVATRQGSAA
jgi:hypothetical protein